MQSPKFASTLAAALVLALVVPTLAFAVVASRLYPAQDYPQNHVTLGYTIPLGADGHTDRSACASCHGANLDPAGAPNIFTTNSRPTSATIAASSTADGDVSVSWYASANLNADGSNAAHAAVDYYNVYLNGALLGTTTSTALGLTKLPVGDSSVGVQPISTINGTHGSVWEFVVHNNPKTGSVTAHFNTTRVNYSRSFTVSGTAYKNGSVATSGSVTLEVWGGDSSGHDWGSVAPDYANVPINTDGSFSFTYAPSKSGKFAVRFADSDVSNPDTHFVQTNVTVVPVVSKVLGNGPTLKIKTTYTFTGALNPRVAATYLQIYKKNSHKRYVLVKSVKATVGAAQGATGYQCVAKWKPTAKGSYRLTWVASGATSAVRGITVK